MAQGDLRYFVLNTGAKMPSVGLGTWQSDHGVVGKVVETAIKIGFVLKKLFEDGVVKREDLFITSKLWNTDHAPEDVPVALDQTLDYVDLYLLHWPVRMKKGAVDLKPENVVHADIFSTWRAMEALFDSGKARAIGVGNFSTKKLVDLSEVVLVPPAVNQAAAAQTARIM